jgi:hypothetical protein
MTSPTEWGNNDIIHPSLPAIVASSDLFDGELFGDELIDIYDSHNVSDGTSFFGAAIHFPGTQH